MTKTKDTASKKCLRTLRLKVKRESYSWLDAAAIEVNQVFNYCNEVSTLAAKRTDSMRKWMTGFDLCALTAGATHYFERIGADTIQRVCIQHASKRRATGKVKLKWRVSGGARRSLGWVPFKASNVKANGRHLRFAGKAFRVFEAHKLTDAKWRDGCFSQDAVGDWWLCLPILVDVKTSPAEAEAVGIDLGLRSIATTSDGDVLEAGRFVANLAGDLARAQRRAHKRQAKRIHRTISRRRQDAIHKFTNRIVSRYNRIVVGDVSSSKLAKTRMAKSVLDSGWGMLKAQLHYKGQQAGRVVEVVSERYTTRACSNCGALVGPSGLDMLAVREWVCVGCGELHDRDINAARNILRSRCRTAVSGNELPANAAARAPAA